MFVKNGSVVTTVRELIGRSSKMRRDDNDYYTRRYLIPNIWTFSTLQKPASSQKGGQCWVKIDATCSLCESTNMAFRVLRELNCP